MSSVKKCLHCGTPVKINRQTSLFCCTGCEYVYGLIHQNGLSQFYDLQGGSSQPAASTVFQKRDYDWLKKKMDEVEKEGEEDQQACFSVQGISCVGCVWLLEKVYLKYEGAISSEVDATTGEMILRWKKGKTDLVDFAQKIQGFGYLLGHPSAEGVRESRRLVRRLGLCGAFSMNAMLFAIPTYLGMEKTFEYAPLFSRILLVFSTLSVLVGGSYFFKKCYEGLKNRVFHIDIPIGLGIGIAYFSSVVAWSQNRVDFLYLEFVSTFTFLMLLGRWVHLKGVEQNRDRLLKEEETFHFVMDEEGEGKKENSSLHVGVKFRLASGAAVPVKSILLSEVGSFGMDWISGETEVRVWRQGEIIPAGALSLREEPILLKAQESWGDSLLKSLLEVQVVKSARNFALEKFIRAYLIFIFIVAFLSGVGWYWKTGNLFKALQVVTSILVVSCPCASGVAIPLVDDRATVRLRRCGVYLRESSLWHRLLKVKKLIFDKTGTLTMESLELMNSDSLRSMHETERAFLYTMVRGNLHPVSSAIRRELLALDPRLEELSKSDEVREEWGVGLEMWREGVCYRLGKASWATKESGNETVWSRDGVRLVEFQLQEKIREEAREIIADFRKKEYQIYLLSGDQKSKVNQMAEALGIESQNALGALSPQEKEEWVRIHNAADTLMLGDGANDSLAFNQSYCTGTPAIDRGFLQKKADFYWMGQSLRGISALFQTAQLRHRTIRRILIFSILYNIVAVGLAIVGGMSPMLAAILMPLSSLVTLGIALSVKT